MSPAEAGGLTHGALHLTETWALAVGQAEAPHRFRIETDSRLAAVVGADLGVAGDLHQAGPPRLDTGEVVDDERRPSGRLGVVVLARLGEVETADNDDVAVDSEPDRCD